MHAAAEQAKLFDVHVSDLDATPQDGMTARVARSTLELLQSQSQRVQGLSEELREARQALNERKRVEQAKQQLMKQQGLSESEAYAWLRQSAMNQGLSLAAVAERLLAITGEVERSSKPRPPRPRSKH